MSQATTQGDLDTDLEFGPPGFARVALRGRLDMRTTVTCWNRLEEGLRDAKLERLEVDASGLHICDGAGMALLRQEHQPIEKLKNESYPTAPQSRSEPMAR